VLNLKRPNGKRLLFSCQSTGANPKNKNKMKTFGEFLKVTTLGGLFVLIPVVLMCSALGEVMDLAVVIVTPLVDIIPGRFFDRPRVPGLIAVGLILVVSFFFGILMLSTWAKAVGQGIERRILLPLPGYSAIKALTRSMTASDEQVFKAALLERGEGHKQFVYLIEDHNDGWVTVLLPLSPNSMAGSVRVVKREQLELLSAKMSQVSEVLMHWGVGSSEVLARENSPES